MEKFYISTAIAYVNGAPHIGHALEFTQADVLARYHRLKGDDTFFLTGTDEHGVKVFETAARAEMDTQAFVDEKAKLFENLDKADVLNISNDAFVRTTDDFHKKGARKIWRKLQENGDIYMDTYKGNYCVGCESYIPDKDLDEDGCCKIHKKKPKVLEEENYFFRLSKYSDRIKAAIKSDELKIVPESRKNEILNIIGEDGLRDVSFSRPKNVLPWGIDVPDDPNQVMYVWGDALANYITALGYADDGEKLEKYWPCDVHLIGKDILRFHAGIWIGMLMSAGLEIPKAIYVHGFITSEGQKMGKSLGNVVDPLGYIEKYGADALRYFLLREIPTTDDGDFSHGRFLEVFNSELANGLGNLLNRAVMMTERYLDGKVPVATCGGEFAQSASELIRKYMNFVEGFDLKKACETVVELVSLGNKYVDDKKPWAMAKEEDAELPEVLYNLLELLVIISTLLLPIIPDTAKKMLQQLGMKDDEVSLDDGWGRMKEGSVVEKGDVLFPRLEE